MRHAPYSTFSDSQPLVAARTSSRSHWFSVVAGRFLWLAGLPRRVAAIRRDMALLGQMNAGELADIGLSRQDLWDAAALPLGETPEPLFARRAEERRRAARARRG